MPLPVKPTRILSSRPRGLRRNLKLAHHLFEVDLTQAEPIMIMTISEQSNSTDLERREAMMTEKTRGLLCVAMNRRTVRRAVLMVVMAAMLFAFGCGSESQKTGNAAKYPAGISDNVEQQLKYDARVDSFDASGDTLTVNVNDAWLNSPPGMQERSVGQWYTLWHSSHTGDVVVQHDGNKVASWTKDGGYKPETKSKSDESHTES